MRWEALAVGKVTKALLGNMEGREVYQYTLQNDNGVEVSCIEYGCAITGIVTPDRKGTCENIVLGFGQLESYRQNSAYFGVVAGRVAGRIANAEFSLAGKRYQLANNDGSNHLHGGIKGFGHASWTGEVLDSMEEPGICFSYESPDGEDGYPGRLRMQVSYTLNNCNEFVIRYQGKSDQMTLLNPTNHTYFNLSGDQKRDILQHELTIKSDRFLELNHQLLPTGRVLPVDDTMFDFRRGQRIEEGVRSRDSQNVLAGHGYDHPFILNAGDGNKIILYEQESGRCLTMETDAVGVVLYTGNQLTEEIKVYGKPARRYLGLCLETQGLPDAIHHPEFPSCVLKAGELFSSFTKYTFAVK